MKSLFESPTRKSLTMRMRSRATDQKAACKESE